MSLQEAIDNIWSSDYVQKNPNKAYKATYANEYAAIAAYLNGGAEPNFSGFSKLGKGLCEAEVHRRTELIPPTAYTYRFATFDPVTDKIDGCLNRFNNPTLGYWWVVGTAEGPAWPKGGGIFPISTPYGSGFSLVCDPDLIYQGTQDSRVVRFQIDPDKPAQFSTPIPFLGSTHRWEWTWRRPSAGNPSGWPSGVFLEGMFFGTRVGGAASVGNHLYIDNNWQQAGPLHYYVGRQTSINTWSRTHCPIPFDADQYHSIKWEIKHSLGMDGYMNAWTDIGAGYQQWMGYSGPTQAPGFQSVYSIAQDIRLPLVGATNVLQWINHRLTLS